MSTGEDGPHQDQPVATAGAPLDDAEAAVVMIHGRGATARSILEMAGEFTADGVTYVAPQAHRGSWYPNSFLAPIESNEPGLSSGLQIIADLLDELDDAEIPAERTLLLGFSQGACLASEFVARNARRYGGLAVLSGGLIGPEGTPRDYDGAAEVRSAGSQNARAGAGLDETPVFLGCSDDDPHIPIERVHETRDVFEALGGDVTERIYPDGGHGVNEDEIDRVRELVRAIAPDPDSSRED